MEPVCTRPINDASGYRHVHTDIVTVHDYDQNPETFQERYATLDPKNPGEVYGASKPSVPYECQPYVVDEYGGTDFWTTAHIEQEERGNGRGECEYGKTPEQVIEELTHILLENPNIAGFTYTQLTDVEQEMNGIYTYDRELKFNPERLRDAFEDPAAIEETD